jgi:hypothetical protein
MFTRAVLGAACLTMLLAPRGAAGASISLSTANVGGGVFSGGGVDTLTSSASAGAGGHRADALTSAETGPQGTNDMRAGARALTTTFDQIARATAEMADAWGCPTDVCGVIGGIPVSFEARIAFEGILDPLIIDLINDIDGTDQASLEVFFQYQFGGGTFNFGACYEPGNAFERAESGCATPIHATYDRADGTSDDLTGGLVFGAGGAVSLAAFLGWELIGNTFEDRMELVTDIRSNDSEVPHILDFFNTFHVEQVSTDPTRPFSSALGRTSLAAAPTVPEPATLTLLAAGLVAAARRLRLRQRTAARDDHGARAY